MIASKQTGLKSALLFFLFVGVALLASLVHAPRADAANLTVTSNADSGDGTLREAVDTANSNGEPDTITFDLPAGSRTITLSSQITFGAGPETTIDGANNVTVSGGDATRVFYVVRGNLSLERITVAGGSAPGDYGGGVWVREGTLTVRDSTFSDNHSDGTNGQGGAIYSVGGALTVTGSTFSGNSSNVGGAINAVRSSASVTNSTFYNNSSGSNGGAIRSFTGGVGSFAVSYSTVYRNSSSAFAGAVSGDATLSNTLLADNTAPRDGNCSSTVGLPADGGYNISDDNTCGFTASTSENETDPLLDAAGLTDNGGPTETVALQEESPALDLIPTGENGCGTTVITDQRGLVRPADGPDADSTRACDSGAYEANAVEPVRGSLSFSAASYTVNEDAGTATITVNRMGGTDGEVSVKYATSNGTATAGSDYTSTSGTLTFANGDDSESFTVPITNDATDEPDETVNLTLSNPTGGATLGSQSTATLTIADDDAAPSLSITDETVIEDDAGTTDATFTVSLSAASGRTVSVNYAAQDDSANAPGDYGATSGTLTFAPGDTTEEITVSVSGDEVDEDGETFFVNLTNPSNATISDGRGVGTITDDDTAGISVDPTSGLATTEAGGTDTFTIVLDSEPTSDVTISLTSSDTTEGTVSPASLTFTTENFDTPQTVTVTGVDDSADDGDVTYEVATAAATSTDANYAGLNAADVSVTNTDDDGAPAVSIGDVSVTEGDSGTREATFSVTLDRGSSRSVTVDFATAEDTAEAPGDYGTTSGTLTFAPGETQESVTVSVNGDALDEPDETFEVNLSNPSNATISDGLGVGTITDDDAAPSLAITDRSVTEGDSGIKEAAFTVRLSSASARTVTVEYATSDGTATSPSDYVAEGGTLTFAPGQTQGSVAVGVRGNATFEPDETFFVRLSDPQNATVSDASGRGTILDDDANKCTVEGTGRDDKLRGTSGRDVICALGGDDTVLAFGGDDIVRGGPGDDTVDASAGSDTVEGDGGNDTLAGGDGGDTLVGGAGRDLMTGQGGDDTLDGRDGSGTDTMSGGPGTDACRRDPGDTVAGCP